MQPFDDISSPELGIEDDVLPAQQRFPTPKWLRSSAGSTSTFTSTLHSLYRTVSDALLPFLSTTLQAITTHLPPLLRPRLTVRYVLSAAVLLYITHRLLTARPLLASPLPPYTGGGPYAVGAVDIEMPLETPRRVSDVKFKAPDGRPAFELQTVLFTLYYPTTSEEEKSSHGSDTEEKMYWIPKPVSATARGYARFLGVDNLIVRNALTFGLWLVAGGITIPARVGAPLIPAGEAGLLDPSEGNDGERGEAETHKLPVVVFSHGMLSSRTDYTSYLGQLASHGIVVAALEHRDGSSPGSAVRGADGREDEWRYAFGLKDLDPSSHTGPGELDTPALKEAQLSFREAEIEAAVAALRDFDSGSSHQNSRRPRNFDPSLFKDRLDTVHLTLAGHSYGGTGVLRALRSSTTTRFAGAVVLDPGKSSGPLNDDVSVPLAVCHSASWSRPGPSLFFGRPHFDVVRDIAEGVNERCGGNGTTTAGECAAANAKGWFLTSLGTSHPSITDAPLLEPLLLSWTTGSTMDARQGIRQYVDLTRNFVAYQHTGAREGLLALSGREGKGDGGQSAVSREYDPAHNEGMPEKWRSYWQLHVAPE